jgi:hypothetical protein
VTSTDAPQPPGGPQRQDAPEGDLDPDGSDIESLPAGQSEEPDEQPLPPVTGEPTQDEDAAALQEENAETSLDQPSS